MVCLYAAAFFCLEGLARSGALFLTEHHLGRVKRSNMGEHGRM